MKTLYFEGAGCVPRGDVENCRIRTAFKNNAGVNIYLEMSGVEVHEKSPKSHKAFTNCGFVDYFFEITENGEKYYQKMPMFEYSKAGILEYVNKNFNCSFEDIKITDIFYGYFVHKDGGGYNLIENHSFDDERADKARAAYNKVDMRVRELLNEKYSKVSLMAITEDSVTVRCYASDQVMERAGLNPKQRLFTESF